MDEISGLIALVETKKGRYPGVEIQFRRGKVILHEHS